MAPTASSSSKASKGGLVWRPTKIMNMRDLSKDDDFLSHLLVEKLGTGNVPLLVHKMDSSRRLPKVSAKDLLDIVRRLVAAKAAPHLAVRQAVHDLLSLMPVRYYLQSYTQKQINAFATHASRYFELYNPYGTIEISHTSRYSHRTGKSELCILATRPLTTGTVITELKGSMANLTDEEDRELKRAGLRNSDIRRDFSVIHSKSMKKNHLFLGPARFVNHDCDHNCELFREGRYITFRVIKPIAIGEEITAHYGDSYFGKKNRHCLCETCERRGRGGYAPDHDDMPMSESSDSDSDVSSSSESSGDDTDGEQGAKKLANLDERRTRRGVYAVVSKEEELSDESENEDENVLPLAGAPDIPPAADIEFTTEVDTSSGLTSLSSSRTVSNHATPEVGPSDPLQQRATSFSSLSSVDDNSTSKSTNSTPFRPRISTRRQTTHQEGLVKASKAPDTSSRLTTRSLSAQLSISKGKRKAQASPSRSTPSTPAKLDKGKEKAGTVRIKKEEADARVLRTRLSLPSLQPEGSKVKEPTLQLPTPKGPDGKPLPLCATCRNILPVISVNSQVVWGLGLEKKKKLKQDCPRCMRHLAIYGQPWPRRKPLPGTESTFVVTPREETPAEGMRRVTQQALPTLDRKLAAAAKRKRQVEEIVEDEVPSKIARISESSTPSKVDRETEVDAPKRKRGRPRLSSARVTSVPIKTEEEDVSLHPIGFKEQTRRMNGRFGQKDKIILPSSSGSSPMKNREQRALNRERAKARAEQGSPGGHKRSGADADVEDNPSSPKKGRWDEAPLKRVFPKPTILHRSGGSLFTKPNPMRYAARAWAGPLVSDDSVSSEDEKGPTTPEDPSVPPVRIVDSDSNLVVPRAVALGRTPSLTYKPSPFNFAKRRWSSLSRTPTQSPPPELIDDSDITPSSSEATSPPSSDISELQQHHFITLSTSSAPVTRLALAGSWTSTHEAYSSEDDDLALIIPPASVSPDSLSKPKPKDSLPKGYPSVISTIGLDRELAMQKKQYPPVTLRKHLPFASSNIISIPNLVNAGWEDPDL